MPFGINLWVLVFASFGLWTILLVTEVAKRAKLVSGEIARKTIHILSGFLLATLPMFASRREIVAINLIFFVGVVLFVGILHRFSAIQDVKRWSIGQFLYPLGVLIMAVFIKDPVIYSFAVLELALADGFAALIGKWQGKKFYQFFGAPKTFLGSFVFFLISVTLFTTYAHYFGTVDILAWGFIVGGSLGITILEGIIGGGFDNLFIPFAAALIMLAL